MPGENSAGGLLSITGATLRTAATAQTQDNSVSVDVQTAQLDGIQVARDCLTLKADSSLSHGGKSSASTLKAAFLATAAH